MRFLTGFLKVFFLAAVVGIFSIGVLFRPLISSSLSVYWDVDVSMKKAKIDWALPGLVLDEVRVGNPYGFSRGDMLEIKQVLIQFDRQKHFLEQGNLKPALLEIKIRKIALVRRVSGHLNLEVLVHPEQSRKKRTLGVSPRETRVEVEQISEMDATSPLLKKRDYPLAEPEFVFSEKTNFKILAQIFAKKLFQKIGLNEEGDEVVLPAPQYYGIVETVEQEIREHVEKEAEEAAAEEEFETLALSDEKSEKSKPAV